MKTTRVSSAAIQQYGRLDAGFYLGWVLKRSDGVYVAPLGQAQSYTPLLQHARVFRFQEEAEAERCPDNETAVRVSAEMEPLP